MMQRIGKLRHRLTLESAVRASDSGGGAALAWTAVAQIWGAMDSASGSESLSADRVSGTQRTTLTIRHRGDVGPAMRFRLGDRVFAILAVLDPDGRRRYLRCLCEERDL